jgi:hypothetical protein
MRNKLFQYTWQLAKRLSTRKTGSGLNLADYKNRIIPQIRLARMMGKISLIVLGDSNAENLNTISNMVQLGEGLPGISVNIGIGGTRVDQWVQFLESVDGLEVMQAIREDKPIVIVNIGGNNALQQRMEGLGNWFDRLIRLLPDAYGCLCPPIHLSYFQGVTDTQRLKMDVATVNGEIARVFKSRCIDLYTPFLSGNGEAYITVLQDAVHFSEEADKKVRIPFLRKSVGL